MFAPTYSNIIIITSDSCCSLASSSFFCSSPCCYSLANYDSAFVAAFLLDPENDLNICVHSINHCLGRFVMLNWTLLLYSDAWVTLH